MEGVRVGCGGGYQPEHSSQSEVMCSVGDLLGHLRKACDAFVFSFSVCESVDMQTRLPREELLGRIREALA